MYAEFFVPLVSEIDSFIDTCDGEFRNASSQRRFRTRDRAVTVRISFHDRHHNSALSVRCR